MVINLLIIDNDNFFSSAIAERLPEGFYIHQVDSQANLKKIIRQKKIDVALLDLSNLKTEGIRLLKKVKKSNPRTEVITINSSEQINLSMEAMKYGAFDELFTPCDIGILVSRIKEAWEKKDQTKKNKKSLLKRYQEHMVAAAFAEAGEYETAKTMLKKK
jgi:DNA-binding NtrC family response regulator